MNGTIPGPTLYVNPGDQLIIEFYNDLHLDLDLLEDNVEDGDVTASDTESYDDETYVHNKVSVPNESNLHFHGLFVSSTLPSDDTTLVIKPGESYVYNTTIPYNHLPGF